MAFSDALTKRLALVITGESTGAVKALRETAAEVDKTNAKLEKINKVKVDPPTGGLSKWVDDLRAQGGLAGKSLDQLGISGQNAGAALQAGLLTGAAAGGAALVALSAKAVGAASALSEQTNKARVIFGDASNEVLKFAQNADTSFGLSQRAATEAASSFGNLLKATGAGQDQIASMSVGLSKLAGDLASFNNISTGDAIQKLLSGLSGESEPLRAVGVFLTEGKVKAEAYASGIAKTGSALTEGQKIQARYNLILKETASAQGDFGRTSSGLANEQRILSAEVENLEAKLGTVLIPIIAAGVSQLNAFVGSATHAVEWVENFGSALGNVLLPDWIKKPIEIAFHVTGAPAIAGILEPLKKPFKVAIELSNPLGQFVAGAEALKGGLGGVKKSADAAWDAIGGGGKSRTSLTNIDGVVAKFHDLAVAMARTQFVDFTQLVGSAERALGKLPTTATSAAGALRSVWDAAAQSTSSLGKASKDIDSYNADIKKLETALRSLPRAQFDVEQAQLAYDQALKASANASLEVRQAEIARIEQGNEIVAQQKRVKAAEDDVASARKALASATDAEASASNAYVAALDEQKTAQIRLTAAEDDFTRASQGAGASSRQYIAATREVASASLAVAQAHLGERNALAAAADAQRSLANAKQFAVQQYNLELAAAKNSAAQAQQGYQQLVVSLAAMALASGQAAAAQALLNDALLDGQAAAQANAQAQILVAQASLAAIQNAISLQSAQEGVTAAQNAYVSAQQAAQAATQTLNAALEAQRLVLQGYGADSREAADALRALTDAQLDASDASIAQANAVDAVAAAQAKVNGLLSGRTPEVIAAENEVKLAQTRLNAAKTTAERNAAQIALNNANAKLAQAHAAAADPHALEVAQRELQSAKNALTRANLRVQDAEKAAAAAQANANGTISGFAPGSPQAQAAAANVATAQAGVTAANAQVSASYAAIQAAVQNVAIVQAQQALAALQQQVAIAQQTAQTTLSIQGQNISIAQGAIALAQLGSDPGRPYREIDAAARGAEGAQLAVKQAAYGSRDAQLDLNEKLRIQEGYLTGFAQGSEEYKAAYDKLRDATKDFGDKQKASNDALKGLNDAKAATEDARKGLVTSLGDLETAASDAKLQIEKIKLEMQLAAPPADIYRQRLNDVKTAAFNLKDQQQKVHDLTRDIKTLMGQTGIVDGYRNAFFNLNGVLYTTAGYLNFIAGALAAIRSGTPATPAAATTPQQKRADGGPVSAGQEYLVGERGPERFVPTQNGTIIPNSRSDRSSGAVTVSVSGNTFVVRTDADIEAVANALARRIKAEMN